MCCSDRLWFWCATGCSRLFWSWLEPAGTSTGQLMAPFHTGHPCSPWLPTPCQLCLIESIVLNIVMFKYRKVPSLLFFSPVRVKSGFGCWITNRWTVLHYLLQTKPVKKHVRWSRLLTSWMTHVFISLCGNICFQKFPVQFFWNSLNKQRKWATVTHHHLPICTAKGLPTIYWRLHVTENS